MKNKFLFFVGMTALLLSCNGNGGNNNPQVDKPSQYTVKVASDMIALVGVPNEGLIEGVLVKIFEMNDNNDKINMIESVIRVGESKTFTAAQNVSKIKVNVYYAQGYKTIEGWLPITYILQPNQSKEIILENFMTLSRAEP